MQYTRNILRTYRSATESQHNDGLGWYANAHNLAFVIGRGDVWKGAGLLSAYSPLTPWWRNMELAIDSANTGIARTDTLPNNHKAAARILSGEHSLDVLGGTKTRHFAENIALNLDTDKVTIDSIAFSASVNQHFAAKKIKGFGVKVYRDIQEAYRRAAKIESLTPSQMQAIVWVTWRDAHPNKAARKGER